MVSSLSLNVTKGHLEEIFGVYGKILSIRLSRDLAGRNNATLAAIIVFDNLESANLACKRMHLGQIDGRQIGVESEERLRKQKQYSNNRSYLAKNSENSMHRKRDHRSFESSGSHSGSYGHYQPAASARSRALQQYALPNSEPQGKETPSPSDKGGKRMKH